MKSSTMTSLGLLVLRVGIGVLMLLGHGWAKVLAFHAVAGRFPDPLGVGSTVSLVLVIFAEVVCSVLLILGLGTRFAAIPLLITMLVAAFVVHSTDPWAVKELALIFGTAYLTLIFTGGGDWALDSVLEIRRKQ